MTTEYIEEKKKVLEEEIKTALAKFYNNTHLIPVVSVSNQTVFTNEGDLTGFGVKITVLI